MRTESFSVANRGPNCQTPESRYAVVWYCRKVAVRYVPGIPGCTYRAYAGCARREFRSNILRVFLLFFSVLRSNPKAYGSLPVCHFFLGAYYPTNGIVIVAEIFCRESFLSHLVQIFLDLLQSWFLKFSLARHILSLSCFLLSLYFLFFIIGGVGGREFFSLFSFLLFTLPDAKVLLFGGGMGYR